MSLSGLLVFFPVLLIQHRLLTHHIPYDRQQDPAQQFHGYIYVWAGLEIVTYLWSWALPLAAGLIVLIPTYRWVYIRVSRCVNVWSKLTMEVEDSPAQT